MARSIMPLIALLFAIPGVAIAAGPGASLTLRDHQFEPSELTVPAGQKIELHITNSGAAPAEFESADLKREKVLPGGRTVTIYVGPLRPGRYEFFDDFHPSSRGHLVAQ